MASIFKQKYTVAGENGKRIRKQSASWYIDYKAADGTRKRVKAFKDKAATAQLAAKLEKESELAQAGIIDRFKEHRLRLLTEHLEDFKKSMLANGVTQKHADLQYNRIKRIFDESKLIYWGDISASKTQQIISKMRKYVEVAEGKRGNKTKRLKDIGELSVKSKNYYLAAMKYFCRWMVQDARASESPLEHLKAETVKKVIDEEHPRRVLELDQLRYLLETTQKAVKRFGMNGHERYLLYKLTAETGLRANEIRSLKVASFDFDSLSVTVSAEFTKNGKEAVQLLRTDTALELREFFRNKLPDTKAFGGTYTKLTPRTSMMIQADLADSGIPYVENGLYFDFHSLRHQTGTLLAASGVHPKVAQKIMRHSDINLTMSRYTHTLTGQEAKAIADLPDLTLPSNESQTQRATGTDCKTAECAYKPAYKKLAKNSDSGFNLSATIGNNGGIPEKTQNPLNLLNTGVLGIG